MGSRYTCIPQMLDVESERHLINLVVEHSGAVISDEDVLRRLGQVIETASRDFDGRVRSHMDVPVEPTLTILTGTIAIDNGFSSVVGVGTLFLSELDSSDWIYSEDNNVIVIVERVVDDTHLEITTSYYGEDLAAGSALTLIEPNVPMEVQQLVRDHAAYTLWARRGRFDDNNPHWGLEKAYRDKTKDVRRGDYRFLDAGGNEISERPVRYDTTAEPVMTDTAMEGWMGDW